jgi:hypothetical protein
MYKYNNYCLYQIFIFLFKIKLFVQSLQLYIDDSTSTAYIQPIIREYQEAYPDFAKSTRTPQKPNFNRDATVDVIHNILKDRLDFDANKLKIFLNSLNEHIKTDVNNKKFYNKKPPKKCLEKCQDKNLYLFINGIEYFKQIFEEKLYNFDNQDLIDLLSI